MGKGIGLIGNFRGKVGNMVGYTLKDSNNKQTQGVRVYQPVVKNPKTYGQAEQRAKLAPVNVTYRALKMIIDRGQEGKGYGNRSRLAWLKGALKAEGMPWFEKGALMNSPVLCELTHGSLAGLQFTVTATGMEITATGVTSETTVNTVGTLSTALMAAYPALQEGDQITFVALQSSANGIISDVFSIIIDTTDSTALTRFTAANGKLTYVSPNAAGFGSVIVSREGANAAHQRSTSSLSAPAATIAAAPYDATSKEAAVKSYMSAAGNSDWPEESFQ